MGTEDKEIKQSLDNLTLAVLLLAKIIAKKGRVRLSQKDRIAFAQIAPKDVPSLISLMNGENTDE